MTSGIYLIKFNEHNTYIGKSNDIDRRWKEHVTKFQKGTAAKTMQNAYNCYGMPDFHILCECHQDHIDLMESIYIRNNWYRGLLNTTQPSEVPLEEENILRENEDLLNHSTAEHIRAMNSLDEVVKTLNNKITLADQKYTWMLDLDENKVLKENTTLKEKLFEAQHVLEEHKRTIVKYENMGFWERMFGF